MDLQANNSNIKYNCPTFFLTKIWGQCEPCNNYGLSEIFIEDDLNFKLYLSKCVELNHVKREHLQVFES